MGKTRNKERTTLIGTRRGLPASDPMANTRGNSNVGARSHTPGGTAMKFNCNKIRMSSWNIGSLNGRSTELALIMKKRNIDIMGIQETKWKGGKSKQLTDGYKLIYNGTSTKQNGVGIILAPHLASKIISVSRVNDRLIMVKLAIERTGIWNFISAYAPQTGCPVSERVEFFDHLENLLESIPPNEKRFILADLNAHVGETNEDFPLTHGGFGFGCLNNEGRDVLEFASTHNFSIVNTWFSKQKRHLATYSSGRSSTQIDFILCDTDMRKHFKDCKVILGESVVTQHRLLLGVVKLPSKLNRRNNSFVIPKIKWHRLKESSTSHFIVDMQEELSKSLDTAQTISANQMWSDFHQICREKAIKALGVSKGSFRDERDTWWWTDEVQKAVVEKKKSFKEWKLGDQNPELNEDERKELKKRYKLAKKRSKVAVAKSREEASLNFYEALDTSEGQKSIYRIAAQRERKAKDIRNAKFIRNDQGILLTNDEEIQERWKSYYDTLLNEEFERLDTNIQHPVCGPVHEITQDEVKKATFLMKNGKATGPDEIPAEFWKIADTVGIEWLTILFNKILNGDPVPEAFRESFLIPFFKNKGDASLCTNYRGIKLLSHTLKILERVIDMRIKSIVQIHDHQCGFMSGKSCADAIQTLRIVIEKCRENKQDLHLVFIDLEKAFDRVPRDVVWAALRWHGVPEQLIDLVRNMYSNATTRIRSTAGLSDKFTVNVGVSQGSALSPLLFILVINYLTVDLMDEIPWSLIFADDVALAAHTLEDVEIALEKWRRALENNGLRISRKKTDYMVLNFSEEEVPRPINTVRLAGEPLNVVESFTYLGSIITNDGKSSKDVQHRIQAGWLKWRSLSGVLCDKRIPIKLKGKIYNTVVKPVMLYGSECWTRLKNDTQRMSVAENRMLRWSAGVTLMDKVRNNHLLGSFGIKHPIQSVLDERQVRWYGHILRRPEDHLVRKALDIPETQPRRRGRPRETWIRNVKKRMQQVQLTEERATDRRIWNLRSRASNIVYPNVDI